MTFGCDSAASPERVESLQPHPDNPYYWQYQGQPVLLLGGTDQDNLFNHPDLPPDGLEAHLDLLVSVGGNYVRNTMSSRNQENLFPYRRDGDLYDLDQWDDDYWERFERFLEMTYERDIIVQIEIWDAWDMFEAEGMDDNTGWESHPYNPLNNVNYDAETSGLQTEFDYLPAPTPSDHRFFRTVPELDNNTVVLPYQEAYVDKLLSYTFDYPHVLYCINNETGEELEWGAYWMDYIWERAREAGREIQITDMRRQEDITAEDHRFIHEQPEIYTYVEISQNNGQSVTGQQHYDQIGAVRASISDQPRPMNNVKVYGGSGGWGGIEEGIEKFWRNIFAGSASSRFHRPVAGIGLDETAQAHIRSMRMITDSLDIVNSEPHNELLSDREANEAYLLVNEGQRYAVYFPDGGSVSVDLSDMPGDVTVRWRDILGGRWLDAERAPGGSDLPLTVPGEGNWAVLISPGP